MKWLLQVKGKRYKVCALFVAIMVLVLLNNLFERRSITNLDHSIASIYHDRLLPATYLFGISNHLHQKRMGNADLSQHNVIIDKLVKEYETTHLTAEEGRQWKLFKDRLQHYNRLEAQQADAAVLDKHFLLSLESLNSLSDIQVTEGKNLQHTSQNIVNDTFLSSHLEISLLIILGLLAIVLLMLSDKSLIFREEPQYLN